MSNSMTSIFDLVAEDFKRELGTIRSLLRRAYGNDPLLLPPSTSKLDGGFIGGISATYIDPNETSATQLQQGSSDAKAGSSEDNSKVKIAASNASMLLLAASFEEYIRQMVKEFTEHLASSASDISELPKQLLEASWERAIYLLKDATYGSKKFDHTKAGDIINRIFEFHIKSNHKQKVADLVAYNNNNMRSKELVNVVGRVGIQDICGLIGSRPNYIQFFGVSNGGQSRAEFTSYLDKFYEERNEIAHSIGSLRVIGATEIERHIQFFEIFSDEFAEELNSKTKSKI